MTTSRDPDRLLRAFIREGEDELHDQVYDAVRAEIEQTRQRTFIGPWRKPTMNKFVTTGLGAAAVVLALVVGVQLLSSPDGGTGGQSSPRATLEPTPRPTLESNPPPSADAFLPEGPLVVWDPPGAEEPSITMTISAPGWIYDTSFSALTKGDEVNNMPEAVVLPGSLPPGSGFSVPGDPCRWRSTLPETPATTVDDIVAALAAQASRAASAPLEVTVDGYSGKMITLRVPDDADIADCDGGDFVSYANEDGERVQWHQGPGQIDDFWFVDVEGSLVEIRAMYRPDTPDEVVAEMRAFVESATFELP